MITLQTFNRILKCSDLRYSNYLLIGVDLTSEQIIQFFNQFNPDTEIGNSFVEITPFGYNAISFDIVGESPFLTRLITKKLKCIGFSEAHNMKTQFCAYQNGEEYNNYVISWTGLSPVYYVESKCWDATLRVTDNTTGATFYIGEQTIDEDTMNYYKHLAIAHRDNRTCEKQQYPVEQKIKPYIQKALDEYQETYREYNDIAYQNEQLIAPKDVKYQKYITNIQTKAFELFKQTENIHKREIHLTIEGEVKINIWASDDASDKELHKLIQEALETQNLPSLQIDSYKIDGAKRKKTIRRTSQLPTT